MKPGERPTKKQIRFADSLGVEIPRGATKQSISKQIDRGIARRQGGGIFRGLFMLIKGILTLPFRIIGAVLFRK